MGTTKPAYMASYDKPNAVSGSPEGGEVPVNTFKTKEPLEATIKSVERIVGPNATGETCHIVIETEGKIPFWEGQSYGIVPPGEKEMPNGKTKPHAPRLYSIASSRYGDEFDGKTTSLCVRRAPASRPTAASGAACSARTPPSSSRAWAGSSWAWPTQTPSSTTTSSRRS